MQTTLLGFAIALILALLAALRDHGPEERGWHPDQTTMKAICMHAAWGNNGGQTTGAMASWLKKGRQPVHWVTGSAAPLISLTGGTHQFGAAGNIYARVRYNI